MFEHFEYDSSKHRSKKGSEGRSKMKRAQAQLENSVGELMIRGKESFCSLNLFVDASMTYLWDSLKDAFENVLYQVM